MSATLLDGKAVAAEMRAEIAAGVAALAGTGVKPGLGVLLVGDNPASRSYVTAKEKACAEAGIHSREIHLPVTAAREEIVRAVRALNDDPAIHGILVQLPLPDASIEYEVLMTVLPSKDVDGFHPVNVGRMMLGLPTFLPCTPHGILHLLKRSGHSVAGKHVVVVGRSNIVGRPLVNLLSQKGPLGNATVTMCHTGTKDLGAFVRQADVVIAAAGRPKTITAEMVKPGAVIVDVGVNRVEDPAAARGFRLVGDVDFEPVREVASAITPVPGGVGPMTITMLLFNTLMSARIAAGLEKGWA